MNEASAIQIGFLIPVPRHSFWDVVGQAARDEAERLGVTLTIRYPIYHSSADQIASINWFLTQKLDAIIVTPHDASDPAFIATLQTARAAGMRIIAIDSPIADGIEACALLSDNTSGMAAVAQAIVERLGGVGAVVHLQGRVQSQVALERSRAVHDILDQHSGMPIVFEANSDWSRAAGQRLMREALEQHADLRAVIAANDEMALGAIDTIAAAGQAGRILVAGFDALPEALLAIRAGSMAATVSRMPEQLGRLAVGLATRAVRNQPVPPVTMVGTQLVTAANLADAALEMLAFVPRLMESLVERGEERRIQALLLDTVEQAVIATDLAGTISYWNRFAETLYGWSAAEAVGRPISFIAHAGADAANPLGGQAELAASWSGECLMQRRDGTAFPALVTNAPLHNDRGIQIGSVSVSVDISIRKQAEEQRLALERKLQETQKLESLGLLAGGIAHDFNNLLVALLGHASLALLDLPPVSPARESIEQIELVAQRAADLTRQLLAYAGKGRFVIQRLNLNAVIEEMTHLLQVAIPNKIALRYNLAPDLPAVEADATQVRQVIMNLVVNAADAIHASSGVVTITSGAQWIERSYFSETARTPELSDGLYAYVEVSDTGNGMDAATRAKIFEPFFTTKLAGHGLGLAAVLGIVHNHRGALKVYSELGRGSTFKFLLPAIDAPAEQLVAPAPPAATWRGSGLVLIVDDDPNVRRIATLMLERLGFTVLLAENGREGVDVFRACADTIICVLLDMTMPQLSGEEAFRQLRQINQHIRVVLMSGYNEQEATSHFVGKGLAGFLAKPFTFKDLRTALQQVLERAG